MKASQRLKKIHKLKSKEQKKRKEKLKTQKSRELIKYAIDFDLNDI